MKIPRIKCCAEANRCRREALYFFEGRVDGKPFEYFADCEYHKQGEHDDPKDQSIVVKEISRESYIIGQIMLA
jgi:hypothetical protein